MSDVDTDMRDMIDRYNRTKIAELKTESGLRWLGDAGPVYRTGEHTIKALFVAPDGTHWADAELVIESVWFGDGNQDVRICQSEQFSGGDSPLHELIVYTNWRGRHTAFLVPVDEICDVLDLEAPQISTDSYARTWGTMPCLTDGHERALVALGSTLVAGAW